MNLRKTKWYEHYESKIKMRKCIFIFVYCLLFTAYCFSQDFTPPVPKQEKKSFWSWDRVYTGGGLGLQFGTVTFINAAPIIGYKITERYSAGIGLEYIYFGYKPSQNSPTYSQNIYGGNIFNRLFVTDFLFLHAEYEALNSNWDYRFPTTRFIIENYWVGGGLRQRSGNASFFIMVLKNLNDNPYSPFPNPQIRMGITVGI